ncbi:hypothetical protein CR513_38775, partial [Mucuna pruriens]
MFEAMKHPTEDHSLFGIDINDELVEDYMQLGTSSVEISNFIELIDVIDYFNSVTNMSDSVNMPNMLDLSDFVDDISNLANLVHIFYFSDLTDLECKCDGDTKVDQPSPKSTSKLSPPQSPPDELKPLSEHLKYAYLKDNQHFPKQEEKLLQVLRKHKKAIGWTLSDLSRINPSILGQSNIGSSKEVWDDSGKELEGRASFDKDSE